MVKETEKFTSDEVQPDLFQKFGATPDYLSANAPDLDIEQEFLGSINYCLRTAKKHGMSRDRIVDRMNHCLPDATKITTRQLNGWTATSQEYRHFPAIYLPAFVWACLGILMPIEVLTKSLGLAVLDEQEQLAMQLGRAVLDKSQASKIERQLKQQLGLK